MRHIINRQLVAPGIAQHVHHPQVVKRACLHIPMVAQLNTAPVGLFIQHLGTAQRIMVQLFQNSGMIVKTQIVYFDELVGDILAKTVPGQRQTGCRKIFLKNRLRRFDQKHRIVDV